MNIFKQFSMLLAGTMILASVVLPATPVFAVEVLNNKEVCNDAEGKNSSVCKESSQTGNPIFGPDGVITFAINVLSVVIGLAAVIVIILAGMKFATSGSNPQEVSKAREMIIYAVVGLIVAALSQFLVRFFIGQL